MLRPAGTSEWFHVERRPRPSLARHVDCIWAARTLHDLPLLPDAAVVELVWSGKGLFVRGADTRPYPVERWRAERGGRYTLWTGDVGAALFASDCLDARAEVPIVDYL